MGATTKYQLPWPEPPDPADVPTDMRELAERVEAVFGFTMPPTTAAPPASPLDGQLWVLPVQAPDSTSALWLLRYNSAGSTYKWEFLGGPTLQSYDATALSAGGGGWIGNTAPYVQAPRAGIYRAQIKADVTRAVSADGLGTVLLSADRSSALGTPALTGSGGQAAVLPGMTVAAINLGQLTVNAGEVVSTAFASDSADNQTLNRGLQLTPLRIN